MAYQLRTPEDMWRLFSALGDTMDHESGGLSIAQVDELALGAELTEEEGLYGLGLSLLVAVAAGWSAIKAYERNNGSMPWGLTWGVTGFLFPVPAAIYSAVAQRPMG